VFNLIKERVVATIIDQINLERSGTEVNRNAIKTCI